MKITVSYEKLKQGLSLCDKTASKNNVLMVLNNVLLKTENGRLKLSSTNLEVGLNYYIGAKIEENGEVSVPIKILIDFINNINEDKININVKNNTLYINSPNYKTQILGSDPKDFPIIPKIKTDPITNLPSKILKNCLNLVIDSVSLSETRPELSGVYVNFTEKNIYFTGTDSFRLAEKIINSKNNRKTSLILPRTTVIDLIKITSEIDDNLVFKFNDNQVVVSGEDFEFVSRVIDGNYPDYQKIIPNKAIAQLKVKKEELDKKVRLASLFSSNIADIKIFSDNKKTKIISKNQERGEIELNLEAELINEPFDLVLNHHYLIDGLKTVSTDNVVFEYFGKGSPLLIKPENSKDMTYLIMPLRS